MRRRGRIDGNQQIVIAYLRRFGATVEILSNVGGGCPDLLVGFRGVNLLVEVKDPSQSKSTRALTPAQKEWHASWKGRVHIIETPEEALRLLEGIE